MTTESLYLLDLSRRLARTFTTLPDVCAVVVTGSVARGECDRFSDVDMIVYYHTAPPPEKAVEQARIANTGSARLWTLGDRSTGSFAEAYDVDGVQCQIVHATVENIDNSIADVLERHDTGTPLHKVMSGLLDCIPLYGDEVITRWKQQVAVYPDALARAVVEHHLSFFPLWYLQEYLAPRDTALWTASGIVETAQNVLGVLAGLNRRYYTTFQFKRMGAFIQSLSIRPEGLYERILALLQADHPTAVALAESLVRETVALVDEHMPEVDTAKIRQKLDRRLTAWSIPPQE